ncbi:MAG: porin family protein [Rhodanobacteraceae bacterium]
MRNTLLSIAVGGALAAMVPTFAQAADSGFFVNGNIGRSSLNETPINDHDTGYGANIGYRWAVEPNALIGIEAGYTDLGNFHADAPVDAQARVRGWNVGANGHFNLNPNWYVSARAGLFRADLKVDQLLPDASIATLHDTHDSPYGGVGFGYDFSNNASVGLNYDYYKLDDHGYNASPHLVSISGEYRY